jgi:PAP2 superfamily/Vanadium chloroperoxidase N-terminal domain
MIALSMLLMSAAHAPAQPPQPDVRVLMLSGKQDMVLKWNDIALHAVRADRSPPPVAARNLAIMHLSIYDAVMAIERTHQAYLVDAAPRAGSSAEAAAAAAAHRALTALYPKQRDYFDAMLKLCWTDMPANQARDDGADFGRFVADKMLESRRGDNSDLESEFKYKREPGFWQPTAPLFKEALLPHWGYVKPFAIKKGTQYQPAALPSFKSDAFASAYHEVKRLGAKDSATRTKEQTEIAHFWADDLGTVTPPGHWNRIAQSIAIERGNTLAENARLFAHLNMGLSDAGVLCWVIKFTMEFWRPITAIRIEDPNWTPLLTTPPFPAYTSGHSTFSGAGAAVLVQSFGKDDIRFSTASDDLPGVTRKFETIWSAAEEAGMSRIYGGIHWQFDNTEGLKVGRTLGEYVFRNTLQPRSTKVQRALYPELPKIVDR